MKAYPKLDLEFGTGDMVTARICQGEDLALKKCHSSKQSEYERLEKGLQGITKGFVLGSSCPSLLDRLELSLGALPAGITAFT